MNKIHVIIGNNGIGKTRFMIKKAEETRKSKLKIVTNLNNYALYNSNIQDDNKMHAIDDIGNVLLNKFKVDGLRRNGVASFEMLKLVMMKGDVLILDEVDALIPDADLPSLMAAITDCKEYWKEVYITGYCGFMDRVFTDTNKDDFTTNYNPNYFTVKGDNLELESITEDEAYEYFDSI